MSERNTDRLISAAKVCELAGGISDVTLHRWLKAEEPPIPQPVRRIGGRRYWSERAVLESLGLANEKEAKS